MNRKIKQQELEVDRIFTKELLTPLIQPFSLKVDNELKRLHAVYTKWLENQGNYTQSTLSTCRKYCQYYYQMTEIDQFKSHQKSLMSANRDNLHNSPSEDLLFKAFKILDTTLWAIRMTNKFMQRLFDHKEDGIKCILAIMMFLASGYLPGPKYYSEYMKVKSVPCSRAFDYTAFFSVRVFLNNNIVFSVGVEKVPIFNSKQRITRYEFNSIMTFIDIIRDSRSVSEIPDVVDSYALRLEDDVARGPEVAADLTLKSHKSREIDRECLWKLEVVGLAGQTMVSMNELDSSEVKVYKPNQFNPLYVSFSEASLLIFDEDMNRWVNPDIKMRIERKQFNQFQQSVNKEMIKKYVDFQSAKNLVDLLQKIPNFKINLTEEEKNVIGQNGNVMVIGRSGTGKTTCAVMRLFSIEMLFKIRMSLNKKKYESMLKDTRFSVDDIDGTFGLHSLFVTASPVLTNEIQRYYQKLTDNIKEEMDRKRKRIEEQRKAKEMEESKEKGEEEEQSDEVSVEIIEGEKAEEGDKYKDQSVQEIIEELPKTEKQPFEEELNIDEEKQHMTQQFEGIELAEEKNQDDNQLLLDDEMQEIENKINRFSSLNDLQQQDYPGFFTVRALIMMIDGTLKKPFFLRSDDHKIVGQSSKAAWHNEEKGVMMIDNYHKKMQSNAGSTETVLEEPDQEDINYSDEEELEHEYQRQLRLRERKNQQEYLQRLNFKNKQQRAFEIDYEYFAMHFWPQIHRMYYTYRHISAHMIWTEIYSTIKGSANSHLYFGHYLSESVYLEKCQNPFLSVDQKKEIYESFCQYERWKARLSAYDLMDVVNYINSQLKWGGYYGPSLHYLMIDEVQDLPHAVLYLLARVAEQGVFFSGDTAQTIAKGVGFRFGGLKTMFDRKHFESEIKLEKPTVLHLSVNFRSHNNILQLANSVINIIEILFPKTIDRLKKETSNLHGPKPMLLADEDIELLFLVLCGEDFYKKHLEEGEGDLVKRPPLEFGCDQVIIVRDQESKKRIPAMLQHALCLTIYEAKGLEFNDVILFNFFAESKCQDRWGIIKFLDVIEEKISKEDYLRTVTKHPNSEKKTEGAKEEEEEEEENPSESDWCETLDDGKISVKKVRVSNKISMKEMNDYGEICSELKLLYTAITRPRNTLIIYDHDQNTSSRKTLERFWEKLGVTQIISKSVLEDVKEKKDRKKSGSKEAEIFQSLVTKTNPEQWKRQGHKMFKRKYYEQAMKCFEMSGDTELFDKSKANLMANEATKTLIQTEAERAYLKGKQYGYGQLAGTALSELKKKLKSNENLAISNFKKAGKLFEKQKMFKQAAQCYFSGKEFEWAKSAFQVLGMNKQVSECLFMLGRYRETVPFADACGDYAKMIESLDMVHDWPQILKTINKYSAQIPETERQSMVRKYAALSLQELVQNIQFENDDNNEDHLKNDTHQPLVIHEKSSDQEEDSLLLEDSQEEQVHGNTDTHKKEMVESEEENDPEVEAQRQYHNKMSADLSKKDSVDIEEGEEIKSKGVSNSEDNSLIEQIDQDPSFNSSKVEEILEKPHPSIPQIKSPNHDSSVSVIDSDNSFLKLNNPQDDSHSDNSSWMELNQPDLQKVKSIADPSDEWLHSALSQIQNRSNTDYSVIDQQDNIHKNARIIKTRGNIFIQDSVMEKIVEIVSIVNVNFDNYLNQLKGHQSLITKTKEGVDRVHISDFEEIDPEFIFKILDILESFKIHKLCIFVCNRYHVPNKIGRYIASMILKYSVTAQDNMAISPSLLAPGVHRKTLLQKGILSSVALHSILQNINPAFLKIKVGQDNPETSLGSYFVTALILEGFFRKTVFIVNVEEALSVLYNHFEHATYKEMFESHYPALEDIPVGKNAIEYAIVTLEYEIWKRLYKQDYDFRFNNSLVSAYFQKEYSYRQDVGKEQIPSYFNFNKCLWRNRESDRELGDLVGCTREATKRMSDILEGGGKYDLLEVYDTVTFLVVMLNANRLSDVVRSLTHNEVIDLHLVYKRMHCLTSSLSGRNHYSVQVLKAILSVYQARLIDQRSKTMRIYGDSYIFIHRSSILVTDLLQNRRYRLIKFQQTDLKLNRNARFEEEVFFAEQNLDVLIAPFALTLELLSQRLLERVLLLLSICSKGVDLPKDNLVTYEDLLQEEEILITSAYLHKEAHNLKKVMDRFKTQLKTQKSPGLKGTYVSDHRSKKHVPSISTSLLSHRAHYPSDDEEEKDLTHSEPIMTGLKQDIFNPHPDLHPELKNYILGEVTSDHELVQHCKLLFVSGQNKLLRERLRRRGGVQLYDAFEFRLFNRIDMYAVNLLDSLDYLVNLDKVHYLKDCLIHLVIHLASLRDKEFGVTVPTSLLQFVQNLQLESFIDNTPIEDDFRVQIVTKQCRGKFTGVHHFTAEQDETGVLSLIRELVGCLSDMVEDKAFDNAAEVKDIFTFLVLNVPIDEPLNRKIQRVIQKAHCKSKSLLGRILRLPAEQIPAEIKRLVVFGVSEKDEDILHQIKFSSSGDSANNIIASEEDYNNYEIQLSKRIRAARVISKWFKRVLKRNTSPELTVQEKRKMEHNLYHNNWPGFLNSVPSDFAPTLFLRLSELTSNLISFYMQNCVSSSLDLHFMLMILIRLSQIRVTLIDMGRNQEIEEVGEEGKLQNFAQELDSLDNDIEGWKNNDKWLVKTATLKKKNVFELKWLEKSHEMKVIKKRQGLKKQAVLQAKKQMGSYKK